MTWEEDTEDAFDKTPRLEVDLRLHTEEAQYGYKQIHVNMQEIEYWLQRITGEDYESFRLEARSD